MYNNFSGAMDGANRQFGLKNQLRGLGMTGGQVLQAYQKLGMNDLLNQQQAAFQEAEDARKQAKAQESAQPTMIPRETSGRAPRVNTIGRNDMETRKWGGTGLGGTTLMPNAAYGGLSYGGGTSGGGKIMGANNAQSSIGKNTGMYGDNVYGQQFGNMNQTLAGPSAQPAQPQQPTTSVNAMRKAGIMSSEQIAAAKRYAKAMGMQLDPNKQFAVPQASISNYMNQFFGM